MLTNTTPKPRPVQCRGRTLAANISKRAKTKFDINPKTPYNKRRHMTHRKVGPPGFFVVYKYNHGVISMSEKKIVLTQDGLKRLESELHELKVVRRKDVAAKIKEARGQGDLSENAEYDAAKEEQAEIEARISMIEKMLRNAEVIVEEDIDKDSIGIGSTVKILDIEFDEEIEYLIVGSTEADPMGGRISNESPLGLALLKRNRGDEISVDAPDGVVKYRILDIA